MPTVTPYEMRLRKLMTEKMPAGTEFKVVPRGWRYKVSFRLAGEEDQGYPHWFEGRLKEVEAEIERWVGEYEEKHSRAVVPTGTT